MRQALIWVRLGDALPFEQGAFLMGALRDWPGKRGKAVTEFLVNFDWDWCKTISHETQSHKIRTKEYVCEKRHCYEPSKFIFLGEKGH